jgi:hypothetical protein
MAELFATQFPQNIDCTLIYDAGKKYYRPFTETDYAGGSGGIDAFGRQRVSEPEMIFNSKQIFSNDPLYFDDIEESGSGTSSTYSKPRASSTLSVSASTAGKRTRQSFMRINYQAGKAQLIFISGILSKSGGGSGIIKRMGYFDDNDGIFLQRSGNIYSIVLRSSVSGSPIDTVITQGNWNLDKMQGNGPSGVNIDFTKTQILVIDFEWLGVGRVRVGFNVDGKTYYFHEFLNANNKDAVYMSTPNLPIRYQIVNDGTGVASSIEAVCCSVMSEGGRENVATNGYISTDGIPITATKSFTNAILGIRLKDGFLGATVDILDVSLLTVSNDNYEWRLIFNPSGFTGLSYSGVQDNSSLEYAIPPNETHISGGYVMAGGYALAKSEIQAESLKSLLKLGSSITGKKDIIVLACYPLGNSNSVVYGGINYREFI